MPTLVWRVEGKWEQDFGWVASQNLTLTGRNREWQWITIVDVSVKTEILRLGPKYSHSTPKSAPKSIYTHTSPHIFIGQKSSVNLGTHPNVQDAVSMTDCPECVQIAQGCLEWAWRPSFPWLDISLDHFAHPPECTTCYCRHVTATLRLCKKRKSGKVRKNGF